MDLQEVKKTVSRIKASLFKNSNSYSIGMLKSHFRGTGLQFKEHQVYTVGDDVRFIDWKLLAKSSTPYIKTFEEERNVEIVVVIDATSTMFYGHKNVSKLQAAIEIACLLYLLAKETNDHVHAIIVGKTVTSLPKGNGDLGITALVSMLSKLGILTESGKINLEYPLDADQDKNYFGTIMKHLAKRKEVVLLSDMHTLFDDSELRKILYNNNLHCFQIISPLDKASKLPYMIYNTSGKERGMLSKVKLKVVNEPKGMNKKVKVLNVEDRYLEDFIKEML